MLEMFLFFQLFFTFIGSKVIQSGDICEPMDVCAINCTSTYYYGNYPSNASPKYQIDCLASGHVLLNCSVASSKAIVDKKWYNACKQPAFVPECRNTSLVEPGPVISTCSAGCENQNCVQGDRISPRDHQCKSSGKCKIDCSLFIQGWNSANKNICQKFKNSVSGAIANGVCNQNGQCRGVTECEMIGSSESLISCNSTSCARTCKAGDLVSDQTKEKTCYVDQKSPDCKCAANTVAGWDGTSCKRYIAADGYCDHDTNCVCKSEVSGFVKAVTCGSLECRKLDACIDGTQVANDYSIVKYCYTGGQRRCGAGKKCDGSGTCVDAPPGFTDITSSSTTTSNVIDSKSTTNSDTSTTATISSTASKTSKSNANTQTTSLDQNPSPSTNIDVQLSSSTSPSSFVPASTFTTVSVILGVIMLMMLLLIFFLFFKIQNVQQSHNETANSLQVASNDTEMHSVNAQNSNQTQYESVTRVVNPYEFGNLNA